MTETRGTRAPEEAGNDREERLVQLGRATGELLHDLGGLLSVLSGRVSLAREEAALGRTPWDELGRVHADTEEIRRMVLEIMDDLRGVRPSPESTFPVEGTLEEVVNRWLMGAPLVTTTLNSSLKRDVQISGPRSFFSRAVGNLLRNAARHARAEIRLSVRSAGGGNAVEIRVEDDGDGVPREMRDRIFDPFVSGSGPGMGLGLSFARWGIERLRGTLEFQSEPSILGGAMFRVTLPISSVARRAGTPVGSGGRYGASPQGPTPLGNLKVAVVDDDSAVRRTFARLLHRSGAEAVEIDPVGWRTATQALVALREVEPDVILLDLHLHTIRSDEAYELLKSQAPELARKVVFFTGGGVGYEGLDRPVVNKMLAWDDFILCILRVIRPEG